MWFYLLGDISGRGTNLFLQGDGSAGNQSNNSQSSSYANNIVSAGAGVGGGAGGASSSQSAISNNDRASDDSSSGQDAIGIKLSTQVLNGTVSVNNIHLSAFRSLLNSQLNSSIGDNTFEGGNNVNFLGDNILVKSLL